MERRDCEGEGASLCGLGRVIETTGFVSTRLALFWLRRSRGFCLGLIEKKLGFLFGFGWVNFLGVGLSWSFLGELRKNWVFGGKCGGSFCLERVS